MLGKIKIGGFGCKKYIRQEKKKKYHMKNLKKDTGNVRHITSTITKSFIRALLETRFLMLRNTVIPFHRKRENIVYN